MDPTSNGWGWWWWCNGVRDIFLAHLVSIENRLNATAYLSIVADHVQPFMTTVFPSSDGYFWQDNAPCHKAQIISGFLNMTVSSLYSNGLHSHQISIQWSTFGMWWNGRFASWMRSRQICSNCVMLSCQYGLKSLRNFSNTLLNLCHEELRQFKMQKEVQPGTGYRCISIN